MFKENSIKLMGTVIRCGVAHPFGDALLAEAFRRLTDYEKTFSANDDQSLLMRINQNAGIKAIQVPAELFELIEIGKKESLTSGGLLNIAIGPLIKLWHIGFKDSQKPSDDQIKQVLPLIDPEKIQLDKQKQTVFLLEKGMEIDLGAVAKGYFADKIMAYFKSEKATSGFIDLGGNVLTFGDSPKDSSGLWKIGIQNPALPRGNNALVLNLKNLSVVTSGIYERNIKADGQIFHHIFDSKTGYPVANDLASLTIISEKSLDGEIWTTKLFGKKAAEVIRELNNIPNIKAIVITKDNQMASTTNALAQF